MLKKDTCYQALASTHMQRNEHARTHAHAHAHSGKRKSIRSVLFISLWFLNTKDMRPINKKFPVKQLWEKRVRTPPQFHQRLVFSSLLLVISGEAQSEKR